MKTDVEIVGLGAQGDGIAGTAGDKRYVAFALPGERVRIVGEDMPKLLSQASGDRVAPLCRHFGACGGCVAQHMGERLYAEWKRGIVIEAFRQHGLAPDIAPLWRLPPHSRRRAVLTARRQGDRPPTLGYHRRKRTDLIDIEECPVLQPAIINQAAALRAVAMALPGGQTRLTVLSTRGGLDVSAEHGGNWVGAAVIADLGRIAAEHHLARIAVNGETVVERAAPVLSVGGIDAIPPTGAFLQAVEAAEMEMTRIVLEAVGRSARVADLFCGLGTFALPMARNSRVLAIDSDQAAVASLKATVRQGRGLKPIETKLRDLLRHPLSSKELENLDAVVFDPPRSGAKAQAERLAQSQVPLAIAVSCDPGTLARDVRSLVDGGYHIERVVPIDQFLFSAHVEAVAILRRRR